MSSSWPSFGTLAVCAQIVRDTKGPEVAVVGWHLGKLIGAKINAAEGTEVDGAPETLVQTENAALLDHFPTIQHKLTLSWAW